MGSDLSISGHGPSRSLGKLKSGGPLSFLGRRGAGRPGTTRSNATRRELDHVGADRSINACGAFRRFEGAVGIDLALELPA
jgi:hypothetical protein